MLAQLASTLRSHENSLLQQGESSSAGVVSDDLPRFGSDPIATLLELGAVLGPPRRITALTESEPCDRLMNKDLPSQQSATQSLSQVKEVV